jgi:hypothetical protein
VSEHFLQKKYQKSSFKFEFKNSRKITYVYATFRAVKHILGQATQALNVPASGDIGRIASSSTEVPLDAPLDRDGNWKYVTHVDNKRESVMEISYGYFHKITTNEVHLHYTYHKIHVSYPATNERSQ